MIRPSKFQILFFIVTIAFLIPSKVDGQRWKLRRYEVGGGVGMTQIFGDIGGTAEKENLYGLKDLQFDETSLSFSGYARYKLDPVYSLKSNLIFGFGHGTDTKLRQDAPRNYKSKIIEFSVQGEYYLIAEERKFRSAAMFNRRGMINNYATISLYGFLGLGGVYASANVYPTENVSPNLDAVSPHSFGVVVPFGAGIKYVIDDRLLFNAELGYRYCSSDYLDGITQIVASKHPDIYYFMTFSIGYRLSTSRRGLPAFLDKGFGGSDVDKKAESARKKPKTKKEAIN